MIKKIFRRRWVCLVWDGISWTTTRARVGDHGIEVLKLGTWVTLTSELVYDVGRYLIVAIDAVPLADHVALEKARNHIALSAVFRSGGDLMRYLQIAAVAVPILVSLYIGYSMSSYGETLAKVSELITLIGANPTIGGRSMIDEQKVVTALSRISTDRIVAADPLSALSDAMVEATAAVGEDTVAAMALLRVYAPAVSTEVISLVESMRLRMTPGALGQLEKLGNSLSMRELLQRVTMNIGGGG